MISFDFLLTIVKRNAYFAFFDIKIKQEYDKKAFMLPFMYQLRKQSSHCLSCAQIRQVIVYQFQLRRPDIFLGVSYISDNVAIIVSLSSILISANARYICVSQISKYNQVVYVGSCNGLT